MWFSAGQRDAGRANGRRSEAADEDRCHEENDEMRAKGRVETHVTWPRSTKKKHRTVDELVNCWRLVATKRGSKKGWETAMQQCYVEEEG